MFFVSFKGFLGLLSVVDCPTDEFCLRLLVFEIHFRSSNPMKFGSIVCNTKTHKVLFLKSPKWLFSTVAWLLHQVIR